MDMNRQSGIKAQSIVEYLIIISALVAGFMLAKDYFRDKVKDGYKHLASEVYDGLSKIDL